MNEDRQQDFKFSMDEESPDIVLREDLQDTRINRLSRRIIIIAVLIPCIIGVVLFFLYLDLKKRVILNQNTGTRSVQTLSRDFESRLFELSAKESEFENTFATRAATIEKRIDSLKFRLYKTDNRIKKVAAAKADRKDQENLTKKVATVSSRITTLDEIFAKKLLELSATVDKAEQQLTKMHTDISTIAADTIDRKTFQQELSKEQKNQEKKLISITGKLDYKLNLIQKDIKKLEKDIKEARKISAPVPPKKQPPATGTGKPAPGKTVQQKPDTIIEKDLN